MASCFVLGSMVLVSLAEAMAGPSGRYCGTALGYNMNLNFTDSSHFDVSMMADGQPYMCQQEIYTFNALTGSIMTNARNTSDCLAGGVKKHFDDADTVFFAYNAKANSITLTIDTVSTELAPTMCGLTAVATGPSGKYCGTALGYNMNLNFTDASHFDVRMTVEGQPYVCKQEAYTFDASTGSITTDVRNSSDCLAGGVRKHYDDPETVFFVYDSKTNSIIMTVDTVHTELAPSMCGLTVARTGPSGKYCGTAQGYDMRLNFTDAHHFDVSMVADGQPYMCNEEPYTFDVSTGSIRTDVRNTSDCLAGGVRKHFDDADTVFFAYDAKANSITLTIDTVSTELAPTMCGLTAAATGPSGKYCGTALGYNMNLNFTDASHFDVRMTVEGQPYMCKQEAYTFDASTGSITTDVRNSSDCLAGGVRKHYDDPETVFFVYDSKTNSITMTVDTVHTELAPSMCGLTVTRTGPSGKYCGTAQGYDMRLNFTDAHHFDVSMVADGQPYTCNEEPYTFDVSTGSIRTDVRNTSDCLAGGVRKHFDDPESVFFSYDSKSDTILLTIDTVNSELLPAACGLMALASVILV